MNDNAVTGNGLSELTRSGTLETKNETNEIVEIKDFYSASKISTDDIQEELDRNADVPNKWYKRNPTSESLERWMIEHNVEETL